MMLEVYEYLFQKFPGIKELIEIYKEIDAHIERFKKITGIDCLEGCGRCCEIPSWKVETTVFELIPLAIHLWKSGEAEVFLKRILRTDRDSVCVFYKKELNKNGYCYVYPLRPIICRLFGFSAIKDKYSRLHPVLCPIIREGYPDKYEMIKKMIGEGLKIPISSFYGRRIKVLDPIYGRDLLSINEALKITIEMVGYKLRLFEQEFEPPQPYRRAA